MKTRSAVAPVLAMLAALAPSPPAQAEAPAALQEKLAAAKQSAAHNQQVLRSYTWIEKTELSVKGEVKNTKIESCRFGPDGKLQKTLVSDPPAPAEKKRGRSRSTRRSRPCARSVWRPTWTIRRAR